MSTSSSVDKIFYAQCRKLIESHENVFERVISEMQDEVSRTTINGDDAFTYAKQTIRHQAIIEGAKLLVKKINSYASSQR